MNIPPPTEKQARWIWMALTGLAMAALVALIAGLLWGMGEIIQILTPVLWPVAVAGVIATLLNPLVDYFQRKGLSRMPAIGTVFAIAAIMLVAFFGSVVPQLVVQAQQFADRVPAIMENLEKRFDEWAHNPHPLVRRLLKQEPREPEKTNSASATNEMAMETTAVPPITDVNLPAYVSVQAEVGYDTNAPSLFGDTLDVQLKSWVTEELPRRAQELGGWLFGQIGTWFGVLISLILVPIYAFYFLVEKYEIEKNWTAYLPVTDSRFKTELIFVLRAFKNYVVAFFHGQVLVAICEGILYTIGFLLIGLQYAVLLGVSAVALTIVPFLGATILCIIAFVVALVQFGDWLHPALVLLVVAIIQTLEAFWISPKIMQGRVGLHPAIIIFAVMTGTTLLGGLLGGILAIPLAALLKVMLSRYVWKRRELSQG